MNASEAKKLAEANKKNQQIKLETKKQDSFNADVEILLAHFRSKIKESVDKGHLSTPEITFDSDRFSDAIIREVSDQLRDDDYTLNMSKHNAYQKTMFTVSWA